MANGHAAEGSGSLVLATLIIRHEALIALCLALDMKNGHLTIHLTKFGGGLQTPEKPSEFNVFKIMGIATAGEDFFKENYLKMDWTTLVVGGGSHTQAR